ncbi:ribonuclease PH [Tetragenococcus muriaticus PMC-11-5]|uniref:Ribonuclease PH n=1 Tax=Tetragenococcus muriaticus PMC-11-5 TaxID=1302649 RepID=A0A091C4S0_9ENTE|nr:ribonuclease PH [Tetragenococcus muriaticus PMC-11-5]
MRHDGRYFDQLREIKLETNVYKQPEGSVVVSFGDTQVICSATIEDSVPPFFKKYQYWLGFSRIQDAS